MIPVIVNLVAVAAAAVIATSLPQNPAVLIVIMVALQTDRYLACWLILPRCLAITLTCLDTCPKCRYTVPNRHYIPLKFPDMGSMFLSIRSKSHTLQPGISSGWRV